MYTHTHTKKKKKKKKKHKKKTLCMVGLTMATVGITIEEAVASLEAAGNIVLKMYGLHWLCNNFCMSGSLLDIVVKIQYCTAYIQSFK